MRILHVTPYFAPAFGYGGPPRSIFGLCRALRRRGVEVEVFTTTANGSGELPRGRRNLDVVPVRYFARRFPGRFFFAPGLFPTLVRTARRFDLLHVHGLWNFPAWSAALVAGGRGAPYAVSVRGMLERPNRKKSAVRKALAFRLVERGNLERAAFLHATSSSEATTLRRFFPRTPLVVEPNGVDLLETPPRGELRRRLGLGEDPVVLYLGRIDPIKRLELLGDAVAVLRRHLPRARLLVAGDGERSYVERLRRRFRELGSAVHWLGTVSEEEKPFVLADADALALCSASENFGMSVAESLAAGVPVVVTRTCPWEEIEAWNCGRWVESRPGAIADGLLEILADRENARRMGARGRELVRECYSWDSIAQRMIAHYEAALRA